MKYILIYTIMHLPGIDGQADRIERVETLVRVEETPLIKNRTTTGAAMSTVEWGTIKKHHTGKCFVGNFKVPCEDTDNDK